MAELRLGEGQALEVEEAVLANGMRALAIRCPGGESATAMVWVDAGSRTEEAEEAGISHALEHAYSLGSRKLAPRELDKIVMALGGTKNAFTTHDVTAYHATLPPPALPRLLELEADRLATLLLPEERIVTELDVIREERRLNHEDPPTARLREGLWAEAYRVHPYGRPVIGTRETLARLDRARLRRYYEERYVPSAVTAVVAGPQPLAETLALLEATLGAVPARDARSVEAPSEPAQTAPRRIELERAGTDVPYVAVLFKACGREHEDAAALEVLEDILLRGPTARLERRLVREERLASHVDGGYAGYRDPSPLRILLRAQPGVPADRLETALLRALEDVILRGVTDAEVRRAKAGVALASLGGLESTRGRAHALGAFAATSPHGAAGYGRWLARIDATTPGDVLRVARRYLVPEGRTIGVQRPVGGGSAPLAALHVSALPPAPAPVRDDSFGPAARPSAEPRGSDGASRGEVDAQAQPPSRVTGASGLEPYGARAFRGSLPGGLTVLLEPVPGVPAAAVVLGLPGGVRSELGLPCGTAAIASSLLRTGAGELDEEALGAAFADLGTALSTSLADDDLRLATYSRLRDLPRALALLVSVVTAPHLADAPRERLRAEAIARRKASRSHPAALAAEALKRRLFPKHRYGLPLGGTLPGLATVGGDAVRTYAARALAPQGAVIALAGGFDPEELFARLEEALAPLAALGASSDAPPPAFARSAATEVPPALPGLAFVPREAQEQAHIQLALRVPPRLDPRWDALVVLATALGGAGLAARLAERVRTQAGLAYGARATLTAHEGVGALVLSAETRAERAGDALGLLTAELSRLVEVGITPQELASVRARLAGTLPVRTETTPARAQSLVHGALTGLGEDYLARQVAHILTLTDEEIRAGLAALDPALATGVVVGPSAARDALPRGLPTLEVDELERTFDDPHDPDRHADGAARPTP